MQVTIDGTVNSGYLTEVNPDTVTEGMEISWYSDSCCTYDGWQLCSDNGPEEVEDYTIYCTRQLDDRGDATGPFNADSTDDDDFTSADMCCSCGGGKSTCDPTPSPSASRKPTPNPTTPAPTTPAPSVSAYPTVSHAPTSPFPTVSFAPTTSWEVGMESNLDFSDCNLDDRIGSMDASLVGATCEVGSGVYFDGFSGYVSFGSMYLGGTMTISVLVYAESPGTLFDFSSSTYYSSYYTLAGELFDDYATWHYAYYAYCSWYGGSYCTTTYGYYDTSGDDDNTGVLNQWKVITYVHDSSYPYVWTIYEDDVQIGSYSSYSWYAYSYPSWRYYNYLGRRANTGSGDYLTGYIKSFKRWDRALDASEVATMYETLLSCPNCTSVPTVSPAPTGLFIYDLYLADTTGDGWNGAEYTIADVWDGTLYGSGSLESGVTDKTIPVSGLRPGRCYELAVTADEVSADVSWEFGYGAGSSISGGDDTTVSFEIDYAAGGPVTPCSLLAPSAPPSATPAPTAVKPIKIELLSSDAEVGFNGAAAIVRNSGTKAEVWRGSSTFGTSYDMMIDGLEELTLYTISLEPPASIDTMADWTVTPVGFAFQGMNFTLLQSVDFVVAGGMVDIRDTDSLTSQLIHALCFDSCDYADTVAAFGNAMDVQKIEGDVTCTPGSGEGLVFGASRRARASLQSRDAMPARARARRKRRKPVRATRERADRRSDDNCHVVPMGL